MKHEESALEAPLLARHVKEHDQHRGGLTKRWIEVSEAIEEVKKQSALAGPLVLVGLLQYSLQTISVMFVGHLGELSLSAASMASSFTGATGFSFMLGMAGALETFCGQAYGAKQYHMLGVHMQRAMVVLIIAAIPVVFLWAYAGHIFSLTGLDLQISKHAGIYAFWLIPSLFPYCILQCQVRFLQAQNNVKPLIMSTCFSSLIHVLVCWTFVVKLKFGNKGAALSSSISYWTNVLVLAFYIKFSPSCEKSWTGFSREGLRNIVSYVTLAVPSALMVCLEHWSYEALVLMSGLLANPKLETSMMSISFNISALVFRIPSGFGLAVSTRVSNELGASNPKAAERAVCVVLFLVLIEGLSLSLTAIAVRNIWGYLYTNEEEVVRYLAHIMPILAFSNFIDGFQGVLSGAARGCGWQKIGALVNLGAYYLVGLPSAITLTFIFKFGGKGLWTGIVSGSTLQSILLLFIAMRTNWEKEAARAKNRIDPSNAAPDIVHAYV